MQALLEDTQPWATGGDQTIFNDDVEVGKHGPEAQLYCDVPGCWDIVRKKNMATGRCFEHPEDADRERSRSPVVRPADRQRRGAATASSGLATVPTADRIAVAIGRLRAGVEMMQKLTDMEDIDLEFHLKMLVTWHLFNI